MKSDKMGVVNEFLIWFNEIMCRVVIVGCMFLWSCLKYEF